MVRAVRVDGMPEAALSTCPVLGSNYRALSELEHDSAVPVRKELGLIHRNPAGDREGVHRIA